MDAASRNLKIHFHVFRITIINQHKMCSSLQIWKCHWNQSCSVCIIVDFTFHCFPQNFHELDFKLSHSLFLAVSISRHSCHLTTNHSTQQWGSNPQQDYVLTCLAYRSRCMHAYRTCVFVWAGSPFCRQALWSYTRVCLYCLSDRTCKLFPGTDNTGDFREMLN